MSDKLVESGREEEDNDRATHSGELFDRLDLLGEIHRRPPLSCGPFVRATRTTFLFGSTKEQLRKELAAKIAAAQPSSGQTSGADKPTDESQEEELVQGGTASEQNDPASLFKSVDDLIRTLGVDPLPSQPTSEGHEEAAHFYERQKERRDKAIELIGDTYSTVRTDENIARDRGEDDRHQAAQTMKSIIEQLDCRLNASASCAEDMNFAWRLGKEEFHPAYLRELFDKRQCFLDDVETQRRCDLFFRVAGGPRLELPANAAEKEKLLREEANEKYRLRARWEVFDHSQNLTAFEDIADTYATSPHCLVPEVAEDERTKFPDRWDALSSFLSLVQAAQGNGQCTVPERTAIICPKQRTELLKQFKQQQLLSARYWIWPIDFFLRVWVDPRFPLANTVPSEYRFEQARKTLFRHASSIARSPEGLINEDAQRVLLEDGDSVAATDARRLLAAISLVARDWLRVQSDPFDPEGRRAKKDGGFKFEPRYRDDFVFSFINDGRAILISDLRPHLGDDVRGWDQSSRTLILDLGLTSEQRGRLLARLMDMATFRILSLRGYPHAGAALDMMNEIGKSLSTLDLDNGVLVESQDEGGSKKPIRYPGPNPFDEEEISLKAIEKLGPGASGSDIEAEMERIKDARFKLRTRIIRDRLGALDNLSGALDVLNLFFTYGVTGKQLSIDQYRSKIRNQIRDLREIRVDGWQTLDEYMKRFFFIAADMDRLADRYRNVRERLNGALNLVRSQMEIDQISQLASEAGAQTGIMKDTKSTAQRTLSTANSTNVTARLTAFVAAVSLIVAGVNLYLALNNRPIKVEPESISEGIELSKKPAHATAERGATSHDQLDPEAPPEEAPN